MPPKNNEDKPANFWDKAIIIFFENKKIRFLSLILVAFSGICFAYAFFHCDPLELIKGKHKHNQIFYSLTLLLLSFPTLTILWIFRTYDTREQIQKTQENINASLFSNGINMLVSDSLKSRCVGLLQLARLRQQGLFIEQIDLATAHTDFSPEKDSNGNVNPANCAKFPKADLSSVDLSGADLSGANLSGANLSGANLSGANLSYANSNNNKVLITDLSEANLSGANLSNAILRRTDLRGADLRGANLSNAKLRHAGLRGAGLRGAGLSGSLLAGAKYNDKTKLPDDDFSPEERGMIKVA